MAASDVLAEFMPDLAKAKDYLPDPRLQAELIQNITDAQQRRIKEMGDLQAQSAAAPYGALMHALESGKAGYEMGSKRRDQNSRLAEEQVRTEGMKKDNEYRDIENKRKTMSLGAEEAYQHWLDQPSGADPTALSRRDKLNQTGYESDLLKPDAERQRQALADQSSANQTQQILNETQRTGIDLTSAKDSREAMKFAQAASAITMNPKFSDEQKQSQIQAMVDHASKQGGMDPRAVNALASTAWSQYQTQKSNAATAAQGREQATELSKPYQDLTNATKSTLGGVGQVSALHQQLQNYHNSLRFGPVHSDKAQAATAGFVGTLRQMSQQGDEQAGKLADYVESSNPLNGQTGDKMSKVLGIMAQRVQDRWHTEYEPQVTPELRGRPEYQQTLQAVQGLSNISTGGKKEKNSGSLFGSHDAKATVDNKIFTNPGAQGGAQAAPVAQPQPQGGPGFSPMPVPGGTVQLPGQGAPQQPAAFNPALRQPMDDK